LRLGCATQDVTRLIAVGFPANLPDSQSLGQCAIPKVFIVSKIDQFCAVPAMESYFATLPEPKELIWIEAQDHFFGGSLDQFEEEIYRVGS
jgi:uncharacterized protein